MEFDSYIKAGKIAAEVREIVRKKNWVGTTVFDICEEVESEIKKRGAKCAFPVNTSINEVAAHYTAEPNDELTISDSDLVKIDLGAQINGYIADTAVTVCYDSQFDMLVQTAEDALWGFSQLQILVVIHLNNILSMLENQFQISGQLDHLDFLRKHLRVNLL